MHASKANDTTDFTFATTANTTLPITKSAWLANSGARTHFCIDCNAITQFITTSETAGAYFITMPIRGRGIVVVNFITPYCKNKVKLTNVAYVPSAEYNLFLLMCLINANSQFNGKGAKLSLYYPGGSVMGIGTKTNKLYYLSTQDHTHWLICLLDVRLSNPNGFTKRSLHPIKSHSSSKQDLLLRDSLKSLELTMILPMLLHSDSNPSAYSWHSPLFSISRYME